MEFDAKRSISLRDGYFVGERSFSINLPANANVFVADSSKLIKWQQKDINDLFSRNPTMEKHFQKVLSKDMAQKLDL